MPPCRAMPCPAAHVAGWLEIACYQEGPHVVVATKPPASRQARAGHILRHVDPLNHICSHVSRCPCGSGDFPHFEIWPSPAFRQGPLEDPATSRRPSFQCLVPIPASIAASWSPMPWENEHDNIHRGKGAVEYTRQAMGTLVVGYKSTYHGTLQARFALKPLVCPWKLEFHHGPHLQPMNRSHLSSRASGNRSS